MSFKGVTPKSIFTALYPLRRYLLPQRVRGSRSRNEPMGEAEVGTNQSITCRLKDNTQYCRSITQMGKIWCRWCDEWRNKIEVGTELGAIQLFGTGWNGDDCKGFLRSSLTELETGTGTSCKTNTRCPLLSKQFTHRLHRFSSGTSNLRRIYHRSYLETTETNSELLTQCGTTQTSWSTCGEMELYKTNTLLCSAP